MQKSSVIDLWQGSKYVRLWSMSYFSVIPAFPPYLVKRFTWSGFEVEPFEVELATFQEFFPVLKRSFL